MSQSPIPYASPNPYPPSKRPGMLTVLGIIGIVFGAWGVLCLGFGDLFSAVSLFMPRISQATMAQPISQKVIGLIMGVIGLGLCGVLLWASIASMNLKPAARRLMVGWSVADIIFDLLRMIIALAILIPASFQNPVLQQNPAFRNNPNSQQIMMFAKVGGVVGAVIGWMISTTYAALVYIFFRRPEIIAAFENPPQNPSAGLPPPPPM